MKNKINLILGILLGLVLVLDFFYAVLYDIKTATLLNVIVIGILTVYLIFMKEEE